jgi:hypothetical protein
MPEQGRAEVVAFDYSKVEQNRWEEAPWPELHLQESF